MQIRPLLPFSPPAFSKAQDITTTFFLTLLLLPLSSSATPGCPEKTDVTATTRRFHPNTKNMVIRNTDNLNKPLNTGTHRHGQKNFRLDTGKEPKEKKHFNQ